MKKTALILLLVTCYLLLVTCPVAFAQFSSGMAISIPLKDKDVKDGSIIVSTPQGYGLSNKDYDSNLYGVLTESPALFLENKEDTSLRPVLTSGKAYALVSTINGNIGKNDFITSSTIAGVGQKALKNGIVLGTALESYTNSDKKATGKILVAINPHYNTSFTNVRANLIETLKEAASPSPLSQLTSLRYILAALAAIIAFGVGLTYFGKVARSGIEALGRNPLASKTIQLDLVFNLILMIIVMVVGLGLAYLILIL